MGNSNASARATEWKGPFSDQVHLLKHMRPCEYDCLVAKFKDVTSAAASVPDVQVKLQSLLHVPLSASVPDEYSSRIRQLGVAFHGLCLYTREIEGRDSTSRMLQPIDFVQTVAACVRSSSQTVVRCLFRLFVDKDSASISENELTQLLLAILVMANESKGSSLSAEEEEDPQSTLDVAKKLTSAAFEYSTSSAASRQLMTDEFVRWFSAQFPLFYSIFVSWLGARCFGAIARPSYSPPRLSHKSDIVSSAHFVSLSAVANPIQNSLYRLYTSAQDGLSFNRLSFHLLGYTGPTLVIIQDTEGAVFGMFCDSEWKESTRPYGGNGCFLFRLEPEINIYRLTASAGSGSNSNSEGGFMYLNSKGYSLPRGIGMGGTTSKFRLFLSEDLDESSYTTTNCMSFESGRLSTKENFMIEAMEVWGCGDEDDVLRQRAFRKDTAEMINRARKVDKAQFVGSDFDKEMFLGKTFGHGSDQARVADDEH